MYLYIHIDHTNFESANFAALQQNKNKIRKKDKMIRKISKKLHWWVKKPKKLGCI